LDLADEIEGTTLLGVVVASKVRSSSAALRARQVSCKMLESNSLIYNK